MRIARLWAWIASGAAAVALIAVFFPVARYLSPVRPNPPVISASEVTRPKIIPGPDTTDLASKAPPANAGDRAAEQTPMAIEPGRNPAAPDLPKNPDLPKKTNKAGVGWPPTDDAPFSEYMKLGKQGGIVLSDLMAEFRPPRTAATGPAPEDSRAGSASPAPSPAPPKAGAPSGSQVAQGDLQRPSAPTMPAPSVTASPRPAPVTKPASAQADDACRAEERSLGIYNSGPCIDIGGMVNMLARGTYHFNKPRMVYLGEPFRITLILKTTPDQDVGDSFSGTKGDVVVREGRFARSLEATLRADDLKIEPAGPQPRTATRAEPVEWNWTLTPQTEGEKRLIVDVAAILHVGDDKHKVPVTTLREAIVIQVGLLQWVKRSIGEVHGLIVAIGGLLGALATLYAFVPPVRRFVSERWRGGNTPATG